MVGLDQINCMLLTAVLVLIALVSFVFPSAPSIPITVNMGMSMPGWYDIVRTPTALPTVRRFRTPDLRR